MPYELLWLLSLVGRGLTFQGQFSGLMPDGKVDPSTVKDCTYYDTAHSGNDDCEYFEGVWAISHDDFVAWVGLPFPILQLHSSLLRRRQQHRGPEAFCIFAK